MNSNGTQTIMVDDVRRRYEIKQSQLDTLPSISDYVYQEKNFILPNYLVVPIELTEAQNDLNESAYETITAMEKLMYFRNYRFSFLCPQKSRSGWNAHCTTMRRLLDWRQDIYPTDSSLPLDATLAPSPRIPKDFIHLRLDARNYGRFAASYARSLENFVNGPWAKYVAKKNFTEQRAALYLNHDRYRQWRRWWDNEFKIEMKCWEGCLSILPMPMWEDVIDELLLMIIDRVEDPSELTNSLCRIGDSFGVGDVGNFVEGCVDEKLLSKEEEWQIEKVVVYLDANTIDLDAYFPEVGAPPTSNDVAIDLDEHFPEGPPPYCG